MLYSCCGLDCETCEAYKATSVNDDVAREGIARDWSVRYNADIKKDDINCQGCCSKGDVHFAYCGMCEIRKCVMKRGIENCAGCADYCCEKLSELLKVAVEAKENLDMIRGSKR